MRAEGVDVRPLRELTGAEMFNEVFLTDVFVPDECLVGAPDGRVGGGPHHARPTSGCRWGAARRWARASRRCSRSSPLGPTPTIRRCVDTLGALVAAHQALAAMGLRTTLRALGGAAPGPESSIRKLLGVELDQGCRRSGLELLGPSAAAADDGEAAAGSAASSATAASRSPAARARSSATSSPSACSACHATREPSDHEHDERRVPRPFRVLPAVDDATRPFWTGGEHGELRILRCQACGSGCTRPARSARAA